MNSHLRIPFSVLSVVAFGSLLTLAGCSSTDEPKKPEAAQPARVNPGPVSISNDFTGTAEVVAIDHTRRTVTLRREDGNLLALQVGQAARNFDQVALGDRVRVAYKQVLSASLRPAGEAPRGTETAMAAGRAEAGAKPGGGVAMGVSTRVKIVSIDVSQDVVVFALPSGELIVHRLATPEGRSFVKGLRVGDTVQLDYAEAVAMVVEKI